MAWLLYYPEVNIDSTVCVAPMWSAKAATGFRVRAPYSAGVVERPVWSGGALAEDSAATCGAMILPPLTDEVQDGSARHLWRTESGQVHDAVWAEVRTTGRMS